MARRADRSSAYAELVSGLLEARHDAASARFDSEVAAAEADGRIDERTARVLRWWQRESVRAVVEHARSVIPPALGAIDEADEEAARHNADAADAWERATNRPLPVIGLHDGPPNAIALPGTESSRIDDEDAADEDAPAAAEPSWAIPAARTAAAVAEGPRRLIVAGLNPLPRGGSSGPTRLEPVLDRRPE